MFCHVYGRGRGRSADQRIPGWPHQVVAALESGPTSWTAVLDVVRLGPSADATAVTAAQLRAVVDRLQAGGHWRTGDPGGDGLRVRRDPAGVRAGGPARAPGGAAAL
jgi:hypothetical protein